MSNAKHKKKLRASLVEICRSAFERTELVHDGYGGSPVVIGACFGGIWCVRLKVMAVGSRSFEGFGVAMLVAGLSHEDFPLYMQYPFQAPSLTPQFPFVAPNGDVYSGFSQDEARAFVREQSFLRWAAWKDLFRQQWATAASEWVGLSEQAVKLEDFPKWAATAFRPDESRLPFPEGGSAVLTRVSDEFVVACLGFGKNLGAILGEDDHDTARMAVLADQARLLRTQ